MATYYTFGHCDPSPWEDLDMSVQYHNNNGSQLTNSYLYSDVGGNDILWLVEPTEP